MFVFSLRPSDPLRLARKCVNLKIASFGHIAISLFPPDPASVKKLHMLPSCGRFCRVPALPNPNVTMGHHHASNIRRAAEISLLWQPNLPRWELELFDLPREVISSGPFNLLRLTYPISPPEEYPPREARHSGAHGPECGTTDIRSRREHRGQGESLCKPYRV